MTSTTRWNASTVGWPAARASKRPGIRGLAKTKLRIIVAPTILLAMALGRIRAGQPENLRSLVRPA